MKLRVLAGVLAVLLVSAVSALADIEDVCSGGIVNVAGNKDFIYKHSAPIRAGGVGTRLIGYRINPTLIMNARRYIRSFYDVFNSEGERLVGCPGASAHGHAGRARCSERVNTRTLVRAAMRTTTARSTALYFRLKNNVCAHVPNGLKCYGSVKGLCDRTLSLS